MPLYNAYFNKTLKRYVFSDHTEREVLGIFLINALPVEGKPAGAKVTMLRNPSGIRVEYVTILTMQSGVDWTISNTYPLAYGENMPLYASLAQLAEQTAVNR